LLTQIPSASKRSITEIDRAVPARMPAMLWRPLATPCPPRTHCLKIANS
jgi:hypothetical protein